MSVYCGDGGIKGRPLCCALLDQFCTLEGQEKESGATSGRRKKKREVQEPGWIVPVTL